MDLLNYFLNRKYFEPENKPICHIFKQDIKNRYTKNNFRSDNIYLQDRQTKFMNPYAWESLDL
jgi:hypothetical protein